MRILYGVVGDGMGHATRSRVVIEHLLSRGHQVRVVVSQRAFHFLKDRFTGRPRIGFHEIHGLKLVYQGQELDLSESVLRNILGAPGGMLHNMGVYLRLLGEDFQPEVVISDFDSWAFLYGLNHWIPVISIDNMQVINRCAHSDEVTQSRCPAFLLAKAAVKVRLPGAWHYLVSSFFFPPVRKERTTLVPPILRPDILEAKREPQGHILVYQTAANNPSLMETFARLPYRFRVYGMGKEGEQGNLSFRTFSEEGFVEDLRSARAVIANGGYSLMSEAVHLGVPMLAFPLQGQYEQELNARYLEKLGYGCRADSTEEGDIESFLRQTDDFSHALQSYPRQGNDLLFQCVDELLRRAEQGEAPPVRISNPGMGQFPLEK